MWLAASRTASRLPVRVGQRRLGGGERLQRLLRVGEKGAAGGTEPDAEAAAVEQMGADASLERRQPLGHRRLG